MSIVLDFFQHDVDAFARFTDDANTALAATTPDDFFQLVRWAMLRDEFRRQDGAAAPAWQERTTLTLLVEWLESAHPGLGAGPDDLLEHPSSAAPRMAHRRARDRAEHPSIEHVLADVITTIRSQRNAA